MNEERTEESTAYKDKLGQCVRIGDNIAYGSLCGSSAKLRIGKVLAIKTTHSTRKKFNKNDATWTEVPWQTHKITVIGIDDSWGFAGPKICQKKGTLHYSDRTVRVDWVPDEYEKLFKECLDKENKQ